MEKKTRKKQNKKTKTKTKTKIKKQNKTKQKKKKNIHHKDMDIYHYFRLGAIKDVYTSTLTRISSLKHSHLQKDYVIAKYL